MDIVALINTIAQGGPTVLFLVLAGLLWYIHLRVTAIQVQIAATEKALSEFQLAYANEKVRKVDVDEIKELIREHNGSNKEMFSRIFEQLNEHTVRCGKDCLASIHARAELNNIAVASSRNRRTSDE